MEISNITCPGCGSSDVDFDPKTRRLICNQCGKKTTFSRAELGSNPRVSIVLDNALKAFKSGDRAGAKRFAGDTLNIMVDNIPSLFIIAYLDEFESGKSGAVKNFFSLIAQDDHADVGGTEIRELMGLFIASLYNMRDYEEEMLVTAVQNLQDPADRKELSDFIDTVSPYCIGKYPSADFMTEERCVLYCDIAENCSIPKTCFALLKGIEKNPDSPYVTGTFYMQARTKYFYENYVLRVGRVINSMQAGQFKQKFLDVYAGCLKKYEEDAAAAASAES